MAPKSKQALQPKSKSSNTRARTVKLDGSRPSSSLKRIDPLTAFSKHLTPPPTSSSGSSNSTPSERKGKAKDNGRGFSQSTDNIDDTLWVDRYEPTTEAELAVHVKKVENVRQWLKEAFEGGPSGVLKKYRRILLLTGRAGTGKTSTIRVLSREMGFEILEWKSSASVTTNTPFDEQHGAYSASTDSNAQVQTFDIASQGIFTRFEAFLTRASTCNSLFSTASSSKPSNSNKSSPKLRIILLEDLPNVLHPDTQARFHQALRSLVTSPPSDPPVPVVIIISDAGMRGEERDEKFVEGRGGPGWPKNQVVDGRTVVPKELLHGAYITEIGFNPIAPTLLRKAVQSLLNKHFPAHPGGIALSPSKEVLDVIVESANGDIRSAIMALQFACIIEVPGSKKKGKARGTTSMVMEAVTRREQSLALFHLLGKVLYNKRKGDPPSSSGSAKDLQRERELDALLKDATKLPPHLVHHERRTSRVDVDKIYTDSPIDSSLFSLYIHQNYIQFCDDLDHCEGISDSLSWVDSSGGDAWYQANPHQFHLLALGTLHSLPSPVTRRSQRYFKPEFFAFLQKEKTAWEGVQMTRDWILEGMVSSDDPGWRAGGWSKNDLILELGAVLKAKDSNTFQSSNRPPNMHKLFSKMEFVLGAGAGQNAQVKQLDENDGNNDGPFNDEEVGRLEEGVSLLEGGRQKDEQRGGWLESDDIEEFE